MFCPQCKAEYRPGFTRCADCYVDLVNTYVQAQQDPVVWKNAAVASNYEAQLWRGTDPHFYFSLISELRKKNIPCLGRPTVPAVRGSSNASEFGLIGSTELEVRVDEKNLAVARRILEATQEDHEKEWLPVAAEEEEVGAPRPVCPLCAAEFPVGSSICSNCGVPLRISREGSAEENPSRVLSDISHPLFYEKLRQALRAARIPFNNANFYDYDRIIGRHYTPSHRVIVLNSDFERAKEVLAAVLQHWEIETSDGFRWLEKAPQIYLTEQAKQSGWLPEDLDAPAWSGKNVLTLDFIGKTLRENEISYRIDGKQANPMVFVHFEEKDRAKEIVREIVEGAPPE